MFKNLFEKKEIRSPLLKGMDYPSDVVLKNPLTHVRLFHGDLCNLKCEYCFTNAPSMTNGYSRDIILARDQYEDSRINVPQKLSMLKSLRNQFGIKTVTINGKGEPTLEPDFDALIRGINKLNLTPVVFTNGTTFENKWKMLYENNASVVLKMNTREPYVDACMFGVKEDSHRFKALKKSIDFKEEAFQAFAKDNRLAINCVLMFRTVGWVGHTGKRCAEEVFRYCRDNGAIPWLSRLIIEGGRGNKYDNISDKDYEELLQDFIEIDKSYGYSHEFKDGMNFGCTPEMGKNFFQITDHGRMFFVKDFGGKSDDCERRIKAGCFECSLTSWCIENNVVRKLKEHGLGVRGR